MNQITINFQNFKFKRFPKIRIHVDNDLIEEIQFNKPIQSVCIPMELEDGRHKLEIEHFDKTSKDTEVQNGNIVSDTKFTITSISIDKFDLPISLLYTCEFIPDWKNLSRPKNFPKILKQSFTVGPNGIWSMFFQTPVENWLINEWKTEQEKIKNMVTYQSYEVSPHSMINYKLTEKDNKVIKEIKAMLND